MSNPSVAIIIPIHNRKYHIAKCLDNLLLNVYDNYQIIIVDDGSTDGTSEFVLQNYSIIKIIYGDGNLWWAGAINKGMRYAVENNFDYILTYNDDQICDRNFLVELVKKSSDSTILSSLILYQDKQDIIASSGILFDRNKGRTRSFCNETKLESSFVNPVEVDIVPGYSVLIPVKCIEQIGYYDNENFPQINMEVEYCLRAKKNGVSILTVPTSIVWNDRSDKDEDPISTNKIIKRFKWFFGNVKSDLNYKQFLALKNVILKNLEGNTFEFKILYYSRFIIKLFFKSLLIKKHRKIVTNKLNLYNNFWA